MQQGGVYLKMSPTTHRHSTQTQQKLVTRGLLLTWFHDQIFGGFFLL